jgi:hypothetical protein
MTRRIEIYSTPSDASKLLSGIQESQPLWYVKVASYEQRSCPVYTSYVQVPDLGMTSRPNRTSSDRYMIFDKETEVVFRVVKQTSAATLYIVDPWKNPPCLLFTCGGIYGDNCVISGLVGTASTDAAILRVFSLFSQSINRMYTRFSRPDLDSFVGPEALALLQAGWRFTDSVSSPPSLDLHPKHQNGREPEESS